MMRIIFFIVVLCSMLNAGYCNSSIDSLWQQYHLQKDNYASVETLLKLGKKYSSVNLPFKKDSVLDIAFEKAKVISDNELLLKVYRVYFEDDYLTDFNKGKTRAFELLKIASHDNDNEWLYEANLSLSKVYVLLDSPKQAQEYANKAFYHVSFLQNDTLKIKCMMQYGHCQERNNDKIEAFRNYLNALYLAEKLDNEELILKSLGSLSAFYLLINNSQKSKEYKQKQIELVVKKNSADSTKLITLYSELIGILFLNNNHKEGEYVTETILNYIGRHFNKQLLELTLITYSSYLMEQVKVKSLVNLYTIRYPQELENLAISDRSLFYRIKAYISEERKNIDSTIYFYLKAEQEIFHEGHTSIYISNFYKRFGQFYLRTGDILKAQERMEQAYEYAKNADYLPYLVETTHYLDSLNYIQGNLATAYGYSKLNKAYTDRQREVNRADEILKLEIDNEARKNELLREREEEETARRHNLQHMGMIIGIVACFVILLMLSRYKVHSLVIKSLGFFSFIFFFEFIVLLADHKIHHATHGEPWKIMAIKVVLIGFLLPLHHWIEGKVVHYLIARERVTTSGLSLANIITHIKNKLKDNNEISGH